MSSSLMLRLATWLVIAVGFGLATVQSLTSEPVLPPLSGLAVVVAFGYACAVCFPAGRWSGWPEALLIGMTSSLLLLTVSGLVAASSAAGLSARTVGAVEVVGLFGVLLVWWRIDLQFEFAPWRPGRPRAQLLRLALMGAILATTGLVSAVVAAQEQPHAPFLELSTYPDAAQQRFLVHSGWSSTLTCGLEMGRPGEATVRWPAFQLVPDGEWLAASPLPPDSLEQPWIATLQCEDAATETVVRRVSILPRP